MWKTLQSKATLTEIHINYNNYYYLKSNLLNMQMTLQTSEDMISQITKFLMFVANYSRLLTMIHHLEENECNII